MGNKREFGEGILTEVTNFIYWLMLLNIYFILTNIIFLFFFIFLETTFSNISLYFLALIPTGPAISALYYSTGKLVREKEISPTKDFFYGYKINFKDTLKLWIPILIVIFIIVVDLQYFYDKETTFNQVLAGVFLVALILILTLLFYVFPINAQFNFRTRDVYRLSVYYSFKKIKVTTGNIAILFLTVFLMFVISDFIILFISSLVCYILMLNSRDAMEDVKLNFVKDNEEASPNT